MGDSSVKQQTQRVALIEQSIADAHIPGDIVVAFNGQPVASMSELTALVRALRPDDVVTVAMPSVPVVASKLRGGRHAHQFAARP